MTKKLYLAAAVLCSIYSANAYADALGGDFECMMRDEITCKSSPQCKWNGTDPAFPQCIDKK